MPPEQAMVLAAGRGERLLPLTTCRPKALFPVANVPIIQAVIHRLVSVGVRRIIINTHSLAGKIHEFIEQARFPGTDLIISHEDRLLGTGGAVGKAGEYLQGSPFFLINSDIVCDIDLLKLWDFHRATGNVATLALHDKPGLNRVQVDVEGRIIGFRNRTVTPGEGRTRNLAFTGIHVLSPEILDYLPGDRYADIISLYIELINKGLRLGAWVSREHYWIDIGTPAGYLQVHRDLAAGKFNPSAVLGKAVALPCTGQGTAVSRDATVEGATAMGNRCRVAEYCRIVDSVLWNDVEVKPGNTLKRCIVADGATISASAEDGIIV